MVPHEKYCILHYGLDLIIKQLPSNSGTVSQVRKIKERMQFYVKNPTVSLKVSA